jgi:hypothetical protein
LVIGSADRGLSRIPAGAVTAAEIGDDSTLIASNDFKWSLMASIGAPKNTVVDSLCPGLACERPPADE